LWSDTHRGELSLDEAEPDVWFLLIVGTKFHLRSCIRRNRLNRSFCAMLEGTENAGEILKDHEI
jgi:hypothetical protein